MKTLKLLTFLALLLLPPGALARDRLTLFSKHDAKATFTWTVSVNKLRKTPAWTPSAGAPPVSISEAVAIAKRRLKSANRTFKRYDVLSISLDEVTRARDSAPDRWYYKIELVPVIDGDRLYRLQYFAAVLLDGTMVEPRVEAAAR